MVSQNANGGGTGPRYSRRLGLASWTCLVDASLEEQFKRLIGELDMNGSRSRTKGEQLIYQCIIRCERGHQFHAEASPLLTSSHFKRGNRKDALMWIKASLIAVGFVAATAAATPAPTLAQGVYIGPGGVAVDVGRPRYREHYRGYHDYAYDRRYGGCRTVTIERAGSTRTIRRCD